MTLPPLEKGSYRWYPEDWSINRIPTNPIADVIKCNCIFDPRARGMVNTAVRNAPKGDEF
jgi:hypothetical protein